MFEQVRKLIADYKQINPADITLDSALVKDLGLNSLDFVSLVSTFEDEFDFEFEEQDLPKIIRVSDLVEYIQKAQQQ